MFLHHFGRWPGRQSLHTAYERVTDHEPGELCGCDSAILYESCCRVPDLRQSPAARWIEFQEKFGSGHRSPPISVVTWVFAGGAAPLIEDVSPWSWCWCLTPLQIPGPTNKPYTNRSVEGFLAKVTTRTGA